MLEFYRFLFSRITTEFIKIYIIINSPYPNISNWNFIDTETVLSYCSTLKKAWAICSIITQSRMLRLRKYQVGGAKYRFRENPESNIIKNNNLYSIIMITDDDLFNANKRLPSPFGITNSNV